MSFQSALNTAAALALGLFVGAVLRYFIERFEKFDVKILSGVLGVPIAGAIISFVADFGPYGKPAYVIGLPLGLILYQFVPQFPKRPHSTVSPFAIESLVKRVEILTADGLSSRLIRTQRMQITQNLPANPQLLLSEISLTGTLGNDIVVTSSTHPQITFRQEAGAGTIELWAIVPGSLKRAEKMDIQISYSMQGTFPTNTEFIGHKIMQETAHGELEVVFPATRKCYAATTLFVFGDQRTVIEDPKAECLGTSAKAVLPAKLRIGHTYRLQWKW